MPTFGEGALLLNNPIHYEWTQRTLQLFTRFNETLRVCRQRRSHSDSLVPSRCWFETRMALSSFHRLWLGSISRYKPLFISTLNIKTKSLCLMSRVLARLRRLSICAVSTRPRTSPVTRCVTTNPIMEKLPLMPKKSGGFTAKATPFVSSLAVSPLVCFHSFTLWVVVIISSFLLSLFSIC